MRLLAVAVFIGFCFALVAQMWWVALGLFLIMHLCWNWGFLNADLPEPDPEAEQLTALEKIRRAEQRRTRHPHREE